MTPWMTVTQEPNCGEVVLHRDDDEARRRPGRRSCRCPPSSVISTTSPDIVPVHVGQRRDWNTSALVAAGEPGQRRRQHEGQQLVVVDVVAERDGARLVLADRLQHLAERRMDRCGRSARSRPGRPRARSSTCVSGCARSMSPNRWPRGTAWMPSSPPVNGACSAEEVDHLRQRQRDHREVDALAADREIAEDQPEQRRDAATPSRIASSGVQAPDLGRVRRRCRPPMPKNAAWPNDSRPT